MKQISKKFVLFSLIISLMIFPNLALAKDNPEKLTDEQISNAVREIVKDKGSFTEPLIVNSGLVDPTDNTKIYFYIFPEAFNDARLLTDVSIQSVVPISSHTIPQGVKMVYSQSNGDPWTVSYYAKVGMSFSTNQSSRTTMEYGHFNADTGQNLTVITGTSNFSYTSMAEATRIRFFIQNSSATSVVVSGSITF
ncbi:hypothetical protein D3C73_751830 [compost metagenome]|uniref:hypothetical protein n=1 Tax=Paenibacillus graminis TaxID=189425 RepID=UPI000F9C92E4|nr:hypothetical protein [Paenibacillus graminis]MEC0171943.1 hypothetical protein [Paenibacillus graminis]